VQLPAILKRLTRLERFTLFMFFGVALNAIYRIPGGGLFNLCFVISFAILLVRGTRRTMRKVLWRLRNRLLVTYVFVGVVPLVLIVVMMALTSYVLFGQIASNMVRDDIDRRTDLVFSAAHDLALSTRYGIVSADFVQDLRQRLPRLRAIVRSGDLITMTPTDGELATIPTWTTPGFKGLIAANNMVFLAAMARVEASGRTADVLAYIPLDLETLADFSPDLGKVTFVNPSFRNVNQGATDPTLRPRVVTTSDRPLAAARGFWDLPFTWISALSAKQLGGQPDTLFMTVRSRPALVISRLFRSLGTGATILGLVLLVIGLVFLVVEGISLILSLRLTRSITRTVHDLYVGTQSVATGDFSRRIPVRAKDQLNELAGSFNSMTERMEHLIAEVKEKEKLEAELEIAREVQAQLFPKGVPRLKTLELAGICNPARVVSGDYYDFVPVDARWTAIVIGDISGKGISAALLMASMQSGLHAQISAFDGNRRVGEIAVAPSTATMVGRLNRQLFENTSPGKYATFYCAVYDDDNARLTYTNAGHLPPILVRDGKASRLEVNGMVIGIVPDTPYEQVIIQLQKGDLLAAFTDGITEAEDEAGEQFGDERLVSLLIENSNKPLDEIVEITTRTVREWAYDVANQDDTTMLLARSV